MVQIVLPLQRGQLAYVGDAMLKNIIIVAVQTPGIHDDL